MLPKIFCLLFVLFPIYSSSLTLVKVGTTPKSCPLNEEPTDCVEYCLPTCDKPKRPPCLFRSCPGGCICKEGYIRETDKGKCVPISSCVNPSDISRNYTEPCKENEVQTNCVTCQTNCEVWLASDMGHLDFSDVIGPECLTVWCSAGCICKKGFIKEKEGGDCIPTANCRKVSHK